MVILFLIIYFLALIIEISFIPVLFSAIPPFSFWIFSILVYFSKKSDVLLFGVLSLMLASVFFGSASLLLAVFGMSAGGFFIKSVPGLRRGFAIIFLAIISLAVFESLRFINTADVFEFGNFYGLGFMVNVIATSIFAISAALWAFWRRSPSLYV